ncbi:MAG: DEAD/DEAH box helicase family protein, partial [Caldilinea sp.]
MSLRLLDLPLLLNTSDQDLFRDFFVPALAHAFRYDRGVGYFASGWLRLVAQGMVTFAAHGGRARWVTSPILNQQDWEALLAGDEARLDPALREILYRNVQDLERSLEDDTLSALAWMIADGVLSFKLALPRGKLNDGDFHDKFGIFTDLAGDRVSFNGSYNDSIQGTRNYESIKVFRSWEPTFMPLVKSEQERFDRLWCNLDPNVRVFDVAEMTESMLRLRTSERPYPAPAWLKHTKSTGELGIPLIWQRKEPSVPAALSLRSYQIEAIEAWFQAGCRGLLEMATGTGKTITSLAGAVRLYAHERRLVLVIACPYQHLVDQWFEEATGFGFRPIRAYQSREKWLDKLNDKITGFNFGDSEVLCVITTHDTFATEHFRKTIERVKGPVLVIADEAHHLGA